MMLLQDLLKTTPIFSHIDYEFPLEATNMEFNLGFTYGCRILKPTIESMVKDGRISSYMTIIGNSILYLYKDKWDKLKVLQDLTPAELSNESATTSHNELNGNTTINSVWGISDETPQNKDKSELSSSNNATTTTTTSKQIDIDKVKDLCNVNLVSVIVGDVANYLTLYVI